MELRHLRYFAVIAEEENFHRAAERLHVSQSPLSRQMKDLETELGVDLLEPSGRGVKLTEAGRYFAQRARTILDSVAAAVEEARAAAQGRFGSVTIGFETGTAYFGNLATIVGAFRKRQPGIDVQLVPMSSAEQWEALREGRIAIGYGYYASDDRSLRHLQLASDRLGIVVSAEHRFASRSRIRVKDLADEPVLMQPRKLYPRLHDDIIAAVRAHGVVLKVASEVVDLEALLTLVASGVAVTFAAEQQATILSLGSAVWKPVPDLGIRVRDLLIWRAQDERSPIVRQFIELANRVRAESRGSTRRR